jgi:membrane fusion protein (multidrug efflux system)
LEHLKPGMVVRAYEEASSKPLGEGVISAIEPSIDAATRNIKVRASVPSLEAGTRPGMFVRVDVVLPQKGQVTVVPLTSVVRASYGDSLFSIDSQPGPDGKPRKVAQQHFVKLGEARGDFVAVLDGVKPGQEVVSAGAFKLRNGVPVKIDNKVNPEAKLAPRPVNE